MNTRTSRRILWGLAVVSMSVAWTGCASDDAAGDTADAGPGSLPGHVDELSVGTACLAGAGALELTMQFLAFSPDGTFGWRPTDTFNDGETPRPFAEVVGPESLSFGESRLEAIAGDAAPEVVTLAASSLQYAPTGGESRAADDRLLVLLLDHSGSLMGQPDPRSPADRAKASDPRDARITFVKDLVLSLIHI